MKLYFLILVVMCGACNFKPVYYRASGEIPNAWCFAQNGERELEGANFRWWQQFGDPVLDTLIREAIANNQDLKVATARVLDFYAQYRIAASKLWPEVDLQASYLHNELGDVFGTSSLPSNSGRHNLFELAFQLAYEIDFWGKIRNATESAAQTLLSQVEARRVVLLTLVSEVASAYIQLRQFDQQLAVSQKTYESRSEYWKLAKLRYEGGLTSEIEVMQAQAESQAALVVMKRFEEFIIVQQNLISVLIGSVPTYIARGTLLEKMTLPFEVPVGLPSQLLENRPDILQAEYLVKAANADIGAARAAFFPAISLTALFGWESPELSHLFRSKAFTWSLGVTALQPLFTGWRLTYQLKEAQARKCEAIHNYQQTILKAFQEVEDALIKRRKNQEIVEVQKERVKALDQYLKLAYLRYENGQTDYLTVLDPQRTLFEAQIDLLGAQGNVFLSLVAIYKALGGGWVMDADCSFADQP